MPRSLITIRDVVLIADSMDARALEVAGAEGVVLGTSEDETTGEQWFAVQVSGLSTVMIPAQDLIPTGRSVSPDEVYEGDRLRVSRHGEVLDSSQVRRPDGGTGC